MHEMKFSMLRENVDDVSSAKRSAYAAMVSPGRLPAAGLLRGCAAREREREQFENYDLTKIMGIN